MAHTAITTDLDESLDIKSDVTAQIALYAIVMVNIFSEF